MLDGMLLPSELPAQWGLLGVDARGRVFPRKGPAAFARGSFVVYRAALADYRMPSDMVMEQSLLVRLLARLGDAEAMNLRIREAMNAQNRMATTIQKLESQLRESRGQCWTLRARLDQLGSPDCAGDSSS